MWSYTLLPKILNMSLTGGIVIALVLLIRLPLRKAPKIFSYALWAVVLFRLLCPVSFSSDFSLLNLFNSPTVTENSITYIPADIAHNANQEVNLPISSVSNAINHALTQSEEQTTTNPLEEPMAIATLLWLLGIAAMLIYSVISLLKLKHKLTGAVWLRDNIYLADHIATPFVIGVIQPRIYLPSALSERERDYIILHEQTHIRRLDHIVKLVAFLALSIHWFNPLVWVAFVCCMKDMEMSCDEAVMKKMGDGIRADYSASLLSLATGRKILAGAPLAFGEGNTKSRIKNVLRYRKPAFWIVAAAVVVCIVLAVCLIANPRTGSNEISYENLGYTVLLPDDYDGKVTLTPQDELDDHTIIEVYQTATLEKDPEMGFMFRIVRHTYAEFEDYYPAVDLVGGVKHFAKDDQYYYSCEMPTDVQADIETAGVIEEYTTLCENIDSILSSFIETNNLTAYDHNAAVYESEYTYPGNHAVYSITLTTGSKYTIILSQPVKQGDGGTWCVERMYDKYDNLYLAMPDTDLTAADYYEEQQNNADAGYGTRLLDAEDVALTYLDDVWGWADDIAESSLEYIDADDEPSPTQTDAAAQAQAVLDSIVSGETVAMAMTTSDGVGGGRYEVPSKPNQVSGFDSSFDWSYAESRTAPSPEPAYALKVESPDGTAAVQCWQGSELVSCTLDGETFWLSAGVLSSDAVFDGTIFTALRSWYDEAEISGLRGDIVIPDVGQSDQEIAQAWTDAYENAMLRATPGSKYACTYVKTTASINEDAMDSWYPDKALETEHFYFDYSTVFVPENDRAKNWLMAGNTADYERSDAPSGALEYFHMGPMYLTEKDWRCDGAGTGP